MRVWGRRVLQQIWVAALRATIASARKTRTWSTRSLGVLFLLTPLLCAQNPDELLAVRLPATRACNIRIVRGNFTFLMNETNEFLLAHTTSTAVTGHSNGNGYNLLFHSRFLPTVMTLGRLSSACSR